MRSSIHVLSCALLVVASGSGRQPPGFRQIVGEYRIDSPAAVRTILTWPGAAVTAAADETLTSTPAWSVAELRAAAMLHTDAALQLVKNGREPESSVHLDLAARFVDESLQRDAAYTGFARRWYVVAAGMLQAHGAADRAAALRARAATSLPPDGDDGGARESYERGRRLEIAGAVEGPLSPGRRIGPPGQIDPRALEHFGAAARAYEKAAAAREQFEASLHLGRVRMLRNADVEAARALTLAERSADPRVKYLARLFLGAIDERAGRFDRAEHWYRASRDAFPWGQSAPIALAELLSRTGDEAGARAVLAESLGRRRGRTVDPLWTYLVEPGDHLGPSLDELRAETWQ